MAKPKLNLGCARTDAAYPRRYQALLTLRERGEVKPRDLADAEAIAVAANTEKTGSATIQNGRVVINSKSADPCEPAD